MGTKLDTLAPTIMFSAFANKYPDINNASVLMLGGKSIPLDSVLRSLLHDITNPPAKIVGADMARWFNLPLPTTDIEFIQSICKSIWEHPKEYTDQQFDSEEDEYYSFTKFLWVEIGNRSCQLADLALHDITAVNWRSS